MCTAYLATGQTEKYQKYLSVLRSARLTSGAMPAANVDGLWTGFYLPNLPGQPQQKWLYFKRPHVGATSWAILAENGVNPFWPKFTQ
jgi:hypothetical protein